MPSFEAGGQRSQEGASPHTETGSGLDQMLAEKARAEARYAYLGARERELLPDLQEQTRLEIAEELARSRFETAKTRAARRNTRATLRATLAEQVREAEAQATQATGELPSPRPSALAAGSSQAEADEELRKLKVEHDRVAAMLSACRQRIQTSDAALRRRYGIPNDEV